MNRLIFIAPIFVATLTFSQEIPPPPTPTEVPIVEEVGLSELDRAIEANDFAKVKQLIDAGADVNEHTLWTDRPIRRAIRVGNLKIVKYLIEKGATGNQGLEDAVDQNNLPLAKFLLEHKYLTGESMVYAAENNNLEMVKLLAANGADVDFSQKRREGLFRKSYVSPIGKAVYHNNLAIVTILVENGLPVEKAILEALEYGRNDIILSLSKQLEDKGWLLVEAFKRGNDPVVEKLISQGVPTNAEDEKGNTLLLIAAADGNFEKVKKCLDEYRLYLHKKNNAGENALMKGVNSGSIPICTLLLERGIAIEAQNNIGETALFYSMSNESTAMYEFLLSKGANPNHLSENGNSLLIAAAARDNQYAMTALLNRGADVNLKNKEGKTAFYYVVTNTHGYSSSHDLLYNRFIDAGADPNTKGSSGETILFKIIERGKLDRVKELIEKGADANTQDSRGERPACNEPEIIKFLIENGADINARDNWDNTYLCEAVKQNDLELAHYLVNKGIDVNKRCYFDEQAIIKAIKSKNLSLVQFLVENGTDLDLDGYMSKNVMEYAQEAGNTEIIAYLRSQGAMTKEEKNAKYKASMKLERDIKSALVAEDLQLVMQLMSSQDVIVLQDKTIENIAYVAAKHGHSPMMNKLLSDDVPFHIDSPVNEMNQTVLFIAAMYEQDDLILDLLSKGANIDHTDRNGKTAVDFASKSTYKKTFKKWSKEK